jgi:cation:H+ antiporter|tara:strand:+ start:938 stop:1915 length:978 start_codon:yes stop_codon:yes gene_type:complete
MEQLLEFATNWYQLTLLLGVIMLIYGGNLLVEGGVALAKHFGISTLVIGLTVVAFSTSSPELALNIVASINGNGDLSIGNIFGSNIANLGLVLGIGAFICKLPVSGRIVRTEFPLLVGTTLLVGLVASFGSLNRNWGVLFLLLFAVIMWLWFRLGRKESKLVKEAEDVTPEGDITKAKAWCALIGGLFILGIGGKATEIGAVETATTLGLSKLIIGSTVVAIATSLPEVVTTVIAARKNHPDLAVGNVVGSNIFNIIFVLPVTMLVHPLQAPDEVWVYASVMFMMTLLAWYFTTDKRIKRHEGIILVALYVCFLVGVTLWSFSKS